MITLNASGGSITFEFSGNSTYLNDGTITVPVNSLALIIDESNMATFRKAASNDIFVSANIAEFGMTKDELESWFKANAVGSTGGGGDITSGEVQTMIDESISGKADSSAVTEEISAAVSGKADSSAVTEEISAAVSGKQDTLSAGTGIEISGNVISATGGGSNLPISAGTGSNSVIANSNSNTASGSYSYAEGRDTKASGQTSHAEGYYTKASGDYSHAEGYYTEARGQYSHAEGKNSQAKGSGSHAEGYGTEAMDSFSHAEGYGTSATSYASHTEGYNTQTYNMSEHASGEYNVSNTGESTSAQTLFSVGNGGYDETAQDYVRHNAFEIRKNGDIYITKDGSDVKLQDQLGGGGSSYTAGDGIDITSDVISVTGKVSTSDFNTYSGAVDTTINSKASQASVDALNGVVTAHTADTEIHVTAQDKSNWNAKSDFSGDYNDLTNKPTIPTVPTNVSDFTNDARYITIDAISGKVDTSTYTAYTAATDTALASKQDTLVSGTNIKTINNESILGSGNITIQGGGGGMTEDMERLISTALVDLNDRKIDASEVKSNYQKKGDYATKSALDLKANASEVMTLDKSKENELVTATALNSINERLIALEAAVQALQALHNNG